MKRNYECCTHYNTWEYRRGYAVAPIFKIAYCCNCGTVIAEWGFFANILWKIYGQWVWNGAVMVEMEEGDENV